MRSTQLLLVPFFVSVLVSGALAACGGSTISNGAASGSVNGTVAGGPLSVSSIVAVLGSSSESGACTESVDGGNESCPSSFSRDVGVLFTNRPDATCAAIQNDVASNTTFEFANFDFLAVGVNVANGDVVAGTYDIVASQDVTVTGANASFKTTSATCATGLSLAATSGTVTLTQFSATSVAGTYNVTFGAQGTLSGSFDVPICNFDAGGGSNSGTSPKQVCQP